MQLKEVILNTTYFGPVQYYTNLIKYEKIIIEQYEHYAKQTYRNRCIISGSSGTINLSIPVKRKRNKKTPVKDILIDYDTDWRKTHHRGIVSCYGSSPFFEFIRDDIEIFFLKKYKFLIDLNTDITIKVIELLGIKPEIKLSGKYIDKYDHPGIIDLRNSISPKKDYTKDPYFSPKSYHQVFSENQGFIPNLSVLDLLFNTGKEAMSVLRNSHIGI